MRKFFAILMSTLCLCPLRAQETVEPDSLQVAMNDSLSAVRSRVAYEALLNSWREAFPLQEVSAALLSDIMNREPDASIADLLAYADSIPFDPAVSSAQSDLRLPLVSDARIPEPVPTLLQWSSQQPKAKALTFRNPFAEQLAWGRVRGNAVNAYAVSHVSEIRRVRGKGSNAAGLDFSRQRIARKEFETTDLVISDAALDLGTATLDIQQVTFHADKWHRKGSTSLQLSQTALSSNWYKGGDNNMTMSTYDKLAFSRYDESMKTTLDIAFELRLSGYYTAADTINPVRVNDNQFRMDVSYGYKAWKNWYYSTSFYAKTPIFDFHSANSKVTKSTFFSPLETNLGIGLDYKKQTSDKNVSFNLMLAPLSYSMTAVCSPRVDERQFGLKEGETTLHQFGSSVTCKLDWKITDMLSWNTRFYYFTTYEKVQLEFENNFNIQLGRYCSAKFYYYPRLDDSRDDHFECKQMLTFGLSWVW